MSACLNLTRSIGWPYISAMRLMMFNFHPERFSMFLKSYRSSMNATIAPIIPNVTMDPINATKNMLVPWSFGATSTSGKCTGVCCVNVKSFLKVIEPTPWVREHMHVALKLAMLRVVKHTLDDQAPDGS